MNVKFNVPGNKRKELVKAIAAWLGEDVEYAGVPTFSYKVGGVRIDRNGIVTFDESVGADTTERLLQHLYDESYESEMVEGEEPSDKRVGITLPESDFDETTEEHLNGILKAKGELFKKVFGVDSLPIEHKDGKVSFPWLNADSTLQEINAFDFFICALCKMAKEAKRVNTTQKEIQNDKYAMRCFLLRLGFIGDDYKAIRKILLKNLSGSSSFKNGKKSEVNE